MFRYSIAAVVASLVLVACYIEVVQSATAVWRISATDGNEKDKDILQSISSLAFKHLLAYAHDSVQNLARVYNNTQTLQQRISTLQKSISEQQEILKDEKYDICDENPDQESCYQCKKRVCYSFIAEHCDPDDLLPPSSIQHFTQPSHDSFSLSANTLRYFDDVPEEPVETDINTLYSLGVEKAKTMEVEMEDKEKPIGRFSDLFSDIQSDVVSFETNVLEEISGTVLEPVVGFSEDAFDVGLETADIAFDETTDGAEKAFKKLKDWGDSFHIDDYDYDFFPFWSNLKHMDYDLFALPSFIEDDWPFDVNYEAGFDLWDGFEETFYEIDMKDHMLEAGDTVADFGSDAGHFFEDNFEEAVVEQPVEGAKSAWKSVKSGLNIRWKRSLPDIISKSKSDVCRTFLKEGEWTFCESFKSDKQCESRCKAEENKEFYCSQLVGHALKLNDYMQDLEAVIEVEQQLARSALQKHGWVAVLLKTMKFDMAARDDRKISLDWIEINPRSFNNDKVWLFDDVTVGYSLKQSGSLYKMGNMKSKLPGPSNVLNIYDLEATKPFAQAVVRDMNQTFFANEL